MTLAGPLASCDCDWMDGPTDHPCICGEHNARPYRDDVVHMADGRHARRVCALMNLLATAELERDQQERFKWAANLRTEALARLVMDGSFTSAVEAAQVLLGEPPVAGRE